jgi:N-acetylglucosamine-6-phosphate deacetylase
MVATLRNLALARASLPDGEAIEGFHVEGPHISPQEGPRGMHPVIWARQPDLNEFHRWQEATDGRVRIVTIAPEWPGTTAYIQQITDAGVVAAIGHTQATSQQIVEAVAAGATMSTHLGNAAQSVLRLRANCIWDQLAEDRITASFIVDGIHLDANFLRVALRAKGVGRAVLVTDAAPPADATPGRYHFGTQAVDLTRDGRVVLAGTDNLAGSSLRMDRAVANVIKLGGIPMSDAVLMATTNAARAGRISGRTEGLMKSERADFVQFRFDETDGSIEVLATWISGRQVFQSHKVS